MAEHLLDQNVCLIFVLPAPFPLSSCYSFYIHSFVFFLFIFSLSSHPPSFSSFRPPPFLFLYSSPPFTLPLFAFLIIPSLLFLLPFTFLPSCVPFLPKFPPLSLSSPHSSFNPTFPELTSFYSLFPPSSQAVFCFPLSLAFPSPGDFTKRWAAWVRHTERERDRVSRGTANGDIDPAWVCQGDECQPCGQRALTSAMQRQARGRQANRKRDRQTGRLTQKGR